MVTSIECYKGFGLAIKRRVFLWVFTVVLPCLSSAGITDFMDIDHAHKEYTKGNYKAAISGYEKILQDKLSDEVRYNLANSYYKNGEYKKAATIYQNLNPENRTLRYQKLHNEGNNHFQQKQYQKALEAYQKALTIKKDRATQENMGLAKSMIKKQQQQQQKQKGDQKDKESDKNQQEDQEGNKMQQEQGDGLKKEQHKSSGQKQEGEKIMSKAEERKWEEKLQHNRRPMMQMKGAYGARETNPW
jgi:tetratricopeptide (TPR) repeat protein